MISRNRRTVLMLVGAMSSAVLGVCLAQDAPPLSLPTDEPVSASGDPRPARLGATWREPDSTGPAIDLPAGDNNVSTLVPDKPPMMPGAADSEQTQQEAIDVVYVDEREVEKFITHPGRQTPTKFIQHVREVRTVKVAVDCDIQEIDLPPNAQRAVVLAVTAARHEELLRKLKEAESDEEKKAASEALKTNYTEHYAVETRWREHKLAELEARLKDMQNQVKQRQESEEKYVQAAMTIAELWAQGISIAPPKPNASPENGMPGPIPTASAMTGAGTTTPSTLAPVTSGGTTYSGTIRPAMTLPSPISDAPVGR